MANYRELQPEDLTWRLDDEQFTFKSTAEVPPVEGTIGQERALRALDFGLGIKSFGYNLYVMGQPGTGRASTVTKVLKKKALTAPGPTDWVYVTGSMHVTGHVVVTPSGNYWNTQKMTVNLNVMQFDLSTGQPTGAPFQGIITDDNYGRATGNSELVTDSQLQSMFPAAPFRGTLTSSLKVGPGNSSTFSADTVCTH